MQARAGLSRDSSDQTTEEDSSRWRYSFGSPQRRLLGSPYSYASSPPWARNSILSRGLSPSPESQRPGLSYSTRPFLNPYNNPLNLNHAASRFSTDSPTNISVPALAQSGQHPLGYDAVPRSDLQDHNALPHDTDNNCQWMHYVPWMLLDVLIAVIVVCLASMLSLLIGHLVLRAASFDDASLGVYQRASIVTTIQAGVIGGAVLSLPFALLVKILFPPRDQPPPPPTSDDFLSFDNQPISSDTQGGVRETPLTRFQLHKVFALMFCECVGVSCGPVGVLLLKTCYAGKAGWGSRAAIRLLDPRHAAEAGALGGIIVGPVVFFLIWICWRIWTGCTSRDEDGRDR